MSRETLLAAAAGAVAGLFLVPALTIHPASAAQLHVTAAPLQTWRIAHGLPELSTAPVEDMVDPETAAEAPSSSATGSGGNSDEAGHEADGPEQPTGPGEPETPQSEPPAEESPSEEPATAQPLPDTVTEVTQDVTAP